MTWDIPVGCTSSANTYVMLAFGATRSVGVHSSDVLLPHARCVVLVMP